MALFGMTHHGTEHIIDNVSASHQHLRFHEIEHETYVEAFRKYLLSDNPQLASQLEIDGNVYILRKNLGNILNDVLGRQATKPELQAWFTYCDFDRNCVMDLSEFLECVASIQEFSLVPIEPKQYTSYEAKHTDWMRHRRVEYDLQRALTAPMTSAQEVGWHTLKPSQKRREYYPNNSTDVTLREGRTAASYYGHFAMQG